MSTPSFALVNAATREPIELAMQRLWLTGQVLPAGARLIVEHVFRSEEVKPLEVIYAFPLGRDAALRSFRITGEGFEAHSELQPTEAAVKAYEEGISQGSLSTLARQYGDGLINLTVGNIRPKETVTIYLEILCGVELRDDGFRFRFPFTLAPAYHLSARAALTGEGEGQIELPSAMFGDVILPPFRADASALHQVGFELEIAAQAAVSEVASPSHSLRLKQEGGRLMRAGLATARDIPNRDLVLDVRFQSAAIQVLAGRGRDGKGHFAAMVPSHAFGASSEAPRRVVILLDRSGSMQGEPIAQARQAIDACLSTLSHTDSFGLLAFDNHVESFRQSLVAGTRDVRQLAHDFLSGVQARGGTELAAGFRAAAALLEGKGGDILILTDGQVSGTEAILAEARSAGVRLHCLGIGSASQDRFLALLARETGGVSRFVTARERVDLSAVDLFASVGRPLASQLKAGANIQPAPPDYVFAGTPVLLFGEADGAEDALVELNWSGGSLHIPVRFDDDKAGESVKLLQGSRLITDWESRYPALEATAPLEKRQDGRVAARLLALSKAYGLASREMALVAVVMRTGDRPGELPETRVVPVGMPQDTALGAYFPAPPQAVKVRVGSMRARPSVQASHPYAARSSFPAMSRVFEGLFSRGPAESPKTPASEDRLMELAARLDADGGMPGRNPDERALHSAFALLAFLSEGHTSTQGAFRSHVARLIAFLEKLTGLGRDGQTMVPLVLERARRGNVPKREGWLAMAHNGHHDWAFLTAAMGPL